MPVGIPEVMAALTAKRQNGFLFASGQLRFYPYAAISAGSEHCKRTRQSFNFGHSSFAVANRLYTANVGGSIPSAPISQRFYGVPPHPMLSQRIDKTLDFMLFLIPWRLSALIDSPA
jgi:hypothetical protein